MTSHPGNGKEASASDYSVLDSTVPGPSSTRDAPSQNAPIYIIPNRKIAAVEIPAVVQNIDRAISAFGRVPSFEHVLDPQRNSVPLYLNPESPFCNPIMSHNAASHNVVLKIILPKRTGRKRKRGSSTTWEGDEEICDADQANPVCSIARQDEPKVLKRKLQDNVGRYKVDAVGVINHTHRFRGFADFYWDMSTSSFTNRYIDQVFSGDVEKMRAFTLEPGIDKSRNSDVIPPPLFTHMSLPFNYFYSQNPYVRTTADGGTVNVTAVKQVGYFISADEPTPTGPQEPPDVTDARFMEVLADLEAAFEDRPIWTRRSLLNHLGKKLDSWNELKKYLNYAAYQFKGGPWRDCVVPYGLDPRTHPKYREYQTLMFKLTKHKRPLGPAAVRTYRRPEKIEERQVPAGVTSHIFDGETYDTDGKVWQVCDITDPLLRELLDGAAVRSAWDISSGWYHGGLWAKVKAIMKTKLVGIRFGRQLTRADFVPTLQFGDMTPPRTTSTNLHLPLPNLRLTDEELIALRGRKPPKKKSQGYNVRLLGRQAASTTDDPTSGASSPSRVPMEAMENDEDSAVDSNEENDSGSEIEDHQLDQLADEYSGHDYLGPEYSAPELAKRSDEPIKGNFVNYMSAIHVPRWADVVEAPSAETPGELSEESFPELLRKELQVPQKDEGQMLPKHELQSSRVPKTQVQVENFAKRLLSMHIESRQIESADKNMVADTDGDESLLIDMSSDHRLAAKWQTAAEACEGNLERNASPPKSSTNLLAAKWQGAWGGKDIQAAIQKDRVKRRVTPSTEQLAAATQPAPKSLAESLDLDDPDHPYFSASAYFCTIINKYVCPKLGCGKYFDSKAMIIRHLKSPAHGDKSYQCPKCLRIFKSVEAITYHAESPGYCRIRETEQYGTFLDQLTGGIVQADTSGGNDAIKYNVDKDAIKKVFW
ncbi:hypothetical protein NHJ6243_002451 [Beauveria neobassiana]